MLREIAFERVDTIVFGGDLAAGPFPRETIELAGNVPNAVFVQGNCDRFMVDMFEGRKIGDAILDPWLSTQIGREHCDFLASFEPTISLDGVLYCHATPRSDEQAFTKLTPEPRVRELVGEVAEELVVVGHTHMQFDRRVGERRIVNAGSVGLPTGTMDACWALVADGAPELRRTQFDRSPLQVSEHPAIERFLEERSEEQALAFFEAQAAVG